MKLRSLLTAAVLCAAPVFADSSLTLPFDTGVDANGAVAASGTMDIHYSTNAGLPVYIESSLSTNWAGPNGSSTWVGPDTGNGSSLNDGVYTLDYYTTFYIPSDVDASTVTLTGLVAADDLLWDIRVNGASNQVFVPYAYPDFTSFTLDQGFQSGRNTIDFVFSNTGGAGGLDVEFTSVDPSNDPAPTPEPASIALVGFGVAGLGLLRRKIKK